MLVLYYLEASSALVKPGDDLEPWVAVDDLDRAARGRVDRLRRPQPPRLRPARAVAGALRARRARGVGVGRALRPRAAWLQVGAMIGTVMAANVFFDIIPAHWELIRAKEAGREPDPRPGDPGEAALGAQQLPHAARAADDARGALPVRVRRRPRLARPRRADGDRRLGAALLQPPPHGADALVDAGRRRRGVRRARRLASSAATSPAAAPSTPARVARRQAGLRLGRLRRLPHARRRGRDGHGRPRPRRGDAVGRARRRPRRGTAWARCRRSPGADRRARSRPWRHTSSSAAAE